METPRISVREFGVQRCEGPADRSCRVNKWSDGLAMLLVGAHCGRCAERYRTSPVDNAED